MAELAAYATKLATVYSPTGDTWAYLDLTGEWPEKKGASQPTLAALAAWTREQIAAGLGA